MCHVNCVSGTILSTKPAETALPQVYLGILFSVKLYKFYSLIGANKRTGRATSAFLQIQ